MVADKIYRSRAINAAKAKIPVKPDKALKNDLDWAVGGSITEAYRLGVEECQTMIIARLMNLPAVRGKEGE